MDTVDSNTARSPGPVPPTHVLIMMERKKSGVRNT
jgi:hypothetical protein